MALTLAEPDGSARTAGPILDLAPLLAADAHAEPFRWITAAGCVRPEALPGLRRDFPELPRAGYHPTDTFKARGRFRDLLDEIAAGAFDRAMQAKFGIDFPALPRLVTVRYTSVAHEGRAHTDSESKVATLLLYLHHGWASPEGRIRVLRSENVQDMVAEVSPEEGNVFAFIRADNSWHGHTPFTGERRVVQVTWLRSQADADRKKKRGLLAWRLKGLFGG